MSSKRNRKQDYIYAELKKHTRCQNPKISVIVPVYKVDQYLTKCLSSIMNQTMEELEIIIVDEGEYDRCREIIDFFQAHDPRIIAPHQKNGGYGASCNLGFRIAKGEYISIIESDDFIEPEMYEEMYYYATKLGADVVKTPYYEYFSDGTRRDCSYRRMINDSVPQNMCFSMKEFGELLQVHASLWSGIYKNSYLKEQNIMFVEAKGAAYVDVGFRIDTLINTNKVAWLDKPYYNYRVDSLGSSTNNFKLTPMLQRWKEEHEKFKKIQDDYDQYFGPQLILDEYLNSVGWLWMIDASKEDYEQISYNLSFINDEMIKTTTRLTKRQKKELLDFKRSPEKFKLLVERYKVKNKIRKGLEKCLNTLANPILLVWLFIGFLTSLCISFAIHENISTFLSGAFDCEFFDAFSILFFIGICCCYFGKIIRKIYFIFLSIHYNRQLRTEEV